MPDDGHGLGRVEEVLGPGCGTEREPELPSGWTRKGRRSARVRHA